MKNPAFKKGVYGKAFQAPLAQPAPSVGKLTDKAMLASLTIRLWAAKKHDKKISQEVASQHGSDASMGRYNKSLVNRQSLERIQKLSNQARQDFYKFTLPWRDDGARILTSGGFQELAKALREQRENFEEARTELLDAYDGIVAESKDTLGDLYDESDYPNKSELASKFSFDFRVYPMPDEGDFRVKLSDEEVSAIRKQISDNVQESVELAMRDVWSRMQTVVSNMAARLRGYKVTKDGVEGIFRDSLVENIRELLDILPALNLTNDPNVVRFADAMRELCKYNADALRENDGVREVVADAADSILKKMQDFI